MVGERGWVCLSSTKKTIRNVANKFVRRFIPSLLHLLLKHRQGRLRKLRDYRRRHVVNTRAKTQCYVVEVVSHNNVLLKEGDLGFVHWLCTKFPGLQV